MKLFWLRKSENVEIILTTKCLDTGGSQLLFATVGILIKYINQKIGNKLLLCKDCC